MGFPLSVDGCIRGAANDAASAARAVEQLLRDTKASTIAVHGHEIEFGVRFFRLVSNWNLLVPIDSGRVVVHEREHAIEVEYHISLRRWFFVATGTVVIAYCVGRFLAVEPSGGFPLPPLVFLWLFLFPLNYFIAALRFPAALRSATTCHAPPEIHVSA
jgi:hypothetical protein